jgi:hypothetical protein
VLAAPTTAKYGRRMVPNLLPNKDFHMCMEAWRRRQNISEFMVGGRVLIGGKAPRCLGISICLGYIPN